MQHIMKKRVGFTLIELSISIVFIAILSIAVTLTIMNTVAAYRRGLVLNQINTTGSDIVDDMMGSLQGSTAQSLKEDCKVYFSSPRNCESDNGLSIARVIRAGEVKGKDGATIINKTPLYGAFCTGNYTYVWNSGYYFNELYDMTAIPAAI